MATQRKRSEPGISRIDQPSRRTYGWFVRVSAHGHLLAKFFPDRSHGGKPKAFAAAKRHRDAVRAALLGKVKIKAGSETLKRIDTAKEPVWVVSMNGKAIRFRDAKYGSPAAAKTAAINYRSAVLVHSGTS